MRGEDERYTKASLDADAATTPEEKAAAEKALRDYRDTKRYGAPIEDLDDIGTYQAA